MKNPKNLVSSLKSSSEATLGEAPSSPAFYRSINPWRILQKKLRGLGSRQLANLFKEIFKEISGDRRDILSSEVASTGNTFERR